MWKSEEAATFSCFLIHKGPSQRVSPHVWSGIFTADAILEAKPKGICVSSRDRTGDLFKNVKIWHFYFYSCRMWCTRCTRCTRCTHSHDPVNHYNTEKCVYLQKTGWCHSPGLLWKFLAVCVILSPPPQDSLEETVSYLFSSKYPGMSLLPTTGFM